MRESVDSEHEEPEELVWPPVAGFARYMRDNSLAMIAGAMIVGVLLARFAFVGNTKEDL